jgi:hypothetical protein
MRELLRTSDPVLVSFVEALLREAGIAYHVADVNTSAIEGSIGIFPRRILVADDGARLAHALLIDAGLAGELSDTTAIKTGARSPWAPIDDAT